ncbi:hypothetical protein [Streptomyces bohaiensis]|uniref:SCO2583 family membrane protein n=1 Tax=Streptomyces bohaiensis TaxID=1431344 RepID=UPI003B7FF9FA
MTAGRSDPPGGAAGEVPDHGDDEFRATVFDESFVRAASLQEHSAAQRLEPGTVPVRPRTPERRSGQRPDRRQPRNGLAVAAVLVTAVLIAVFLGNSGLRPTVHRGAEIVPAGSLLPLQPPGTVPDQDTGDPYVGSVADTYGTALILPEAAAVGDWDRDQVIDALMLARRYVTASSLTPDVLVAGAVAPVRALLTPFQQQRMDRALRPGPAPARASTFLVRFAPGTVELAGDGPRVEGTFTVEQAPGRLTVLARHRFAYALVPADDPRAAPSLFRLHREVVLSFGEAELAAGQVSLESVTATAGPLDCADPADAASLRPLLAGQRAAGAPQDTSGTGAGDDPDPTPGAGAGEPSAEASPGAAPRTAPDEQPPVAPGADGSGDHPVEQGPAGGSEAPDGLDPLSLPATGASLCGVLADG